MVLASDAAHYYENFMARKPFPIVVDLQNMLDGFKTLESLATKPELIIPGHDPIVRQIFPKGLADHISRLDVGPISEIPK
jgi:glyoxylase-like metal-dependent hydrolase (beta-lactamase superfamily II)